MNIERITGDTRIVYNFSVHIDETARQIIVTPSGASIQERASSDAQWHVVTSIQYERPADPADTGSIYGTAHDYTQDRAPINRRDYDLLIPNDVWAEALAGFKVIKGA